MEAGSVTPGASRACFLEHVFKETGFKIHVKKR